jgi:hypothetical protein
MQCPTCTHDNPAGSSFCEECGVRLRASCPACGTEISPTAKFCRSCGAALTPTDGERGPAAQPAPVATPSRPEPRSFAGGRYQVKRFLGEGARNASTWPTTLSSTAT